MPSGCNIVVAPQPTASPNLAPAHFRPPAGAPEHFRANFDMLAATSGPRPCGSSHMTYLKKSIRPNFEPLFGIQRTRRDACLSRLPYDLSTPCVPHAADHCPLPAYDSAGVRNGGAGGRARTEHAERAQRPTDARDTAIGGRRRRTLMSTATPTRPQPPPPPHRRPSLPHRRHSPPSPRPTAAPISLPGGRPPAAFPLHDGPAPPPPHQPYNKNNADIRVLCAVVRVFSRITAGCGYGGRGARK